MVRVISLSLARKCHATYVKGLLLPEKNYLNYLVTTTKLPNPKNNVGDWNRACIHTETKTKFSMIMVILNINKIK